MPLDRVQRKLCSICAHPEVEAIAAALSRGDSLRTIEGAYGVNKSSVSRHTRQCLTAVSVAPQAVTPIHREQLTAPAHLVNAALHHELTQIYNALSNHNYLVDARRGLQAVTALLLKMIMDDAGDDRTTG